MRKIKVLNVIGKRPTGGIGTVVYNYQSSFKTNLIQYDYMIFNDEKNGEFDEKVKALGSNVFVMPDLKHSRLKSLYKLLDEFFKYNKYDFVHLHSVNIGFLCYPLARKYGVEKLIAHSHATKFSDKKLNAIRNKLLCFNLKKQANIYFACSEKAGRFLYGDKLFEEGKVKILNNAIKSDKFQFNEKIRREFRDKFNLNGKRVIGHVGRFVEQKNHEFLLEVFSEICKINDNYRLVLVGDGPLLEDIEKKVENLGIAEKILFLGKRNDAEKIFNLFDIFVLPSLYEGLPLVGVEAQANGLECIMANTITEEINLGKVKYLNLSVEEWRNELIKYNNKNRISRKNEVKNTKFDIDIEVSKLEEFYLNGR